MNCREFENELQALGDAPEAHYSVQAKEHLAQCASCTTLAQRVQQQWLLWLREAQLQAPELLERRVAQALHSAHPIRKADYRFLKPLASLAAAMVVGLFLGIGLGNFYAEGVQPETNELAQELYLFSDLADQSIDYTLLNNDNNE